MNKTLAKFACAAVVLITTALPLQVHAGSYKDGKVCNKACIKDINNSFTRGKVSNADAKTVGTFTVVEMKTEKGAVRAVGINVDTNEMYVMQMTPISDDKAGNTKKGSKLTERAQVKAFNLARTFSIADGFKHSSKDKHVYVFIDPNCPFCHKLITSVLKRSYRGYNFHFIPVKALSGTTTEEVSFAIEHDLKSILKNEFKKGQYSTAENMYNSSAYMALTQVLQRAGVPLIIAESGDVEVGFGSSSELKRFLKKSERR